MDGLGVGEGEGCQNVSSQIEYEEQLLGEKDKAEEKEKENNKGEQEKEKENNKAEKEKEEGFDMEQDFEGINQDLNSDQ